MATDVEQLAQFQRIAMAMSVEEYTQQATTVLKMFKPSADGVKINQFGLKRGFKKRANPSMAAPSFSGDVVATPNGPAYGHHIVPYINLEAGTEVTYNTLLEHGLETAKQKLSELCMADARQFSKYMEYWSCDGTGLNSLATISAVTGAGSSPAFTCNGTDSFGTTRLMARAAMQTAAGLGAPPATPGQTVRVLSAGGVLRNGGSGSGLLEVATLPTKTTGTFGSNVPSDVIAGDKICIQGPQSGGLLGLPGLIRQSGVLFGVDYGAEPIVQSSIINAAGAPISAALLMALQAKMMYRLEDDELGMQVDVTSIAQWQSYHNRMIAAGVQYKYQGGSRPEVDLGPASMNFTWSGGKIIHARDIEASAWYKVVPQYMKQAVRKAVGDVGMKGLNGDVQLYDPTGLPRHAQGNWRDFSGQNYLEHPHCFGALLALDTTGMQTQKS